VARVLILGAGGLAGSDIARALAAEGHELALPPRAELDVLDSTACAHAVFEFVPEVVVDCTGVGDEQDGVEGTVVEAARNVATATEALDAHLIYLSCARVFDGAAGDEYAEPAPVAPGTPFGRAKAVAERTVADLCERHTIVRSSWLFGAERPNFVSDVIEHGRATDRVVVAEGRRSSPTHTADLAAAIERLIAPARYGIHHLVAAGSCTPVQLVRNAFRLAGVECEVVPSAGEVATVRLPPSGPSLTTVRDGAELPEWRTGLADYTQLLAGMRARPEER
jgi:dTDP-4-dehydrorhamnose reductase